MSYFAKVCDGIVVQVIAAEKEFFDVYVDTTPGEWIQTSYNTRGGIHYKPESWDRHDNWEPSEDQSKALRGNFAGVGFIYDRKNDVFYEPQPYPSWTLNKTTWAWEPPVAMPTDLQPYIWDEATLNWIVTPTD